MAHINYFIYVMTREHGHTIPTLQSGTSCHLISGYITDQRPSRPPMSLGERYLPN